MCGRFTLLHVLRIEDVMPGVDLDDFAWEPRYNLAPTQTVAVVANTGQMKLEGFRWGLIPSWAKEAAIGNRMINARAETLDAKPAFRKPLERRRCLVWADGFYEWKKAAGGKGGGGKVPMYVRMRDGGVFAFAGLWEEWRDPAGAGEEVVRSCTVITTPPNELMVSIHDRMPAILPREGYRDWLDPEPRKAAEMMAWLRPYPAEAMEAYAVGTGVNSPGNEGAELIVPAKDEPPARRKRKSGPAQGDLFGMG